MDSSERGDLMFRALAAAVPLAVVVLWTSLAFFNPYAASFADGPSLWVVYGIFAGLAITGLVAAVKGEAVILGLVGLISFVPVGFYLLLTPGIFRWIGALDLAMILVAVAMWRRGGRAQSA